MKKFLFFLVAALSLSGCTHFQKVPNEWVFVEQNGQWGMIRRQFVTIILPFGKNCYGWIDEGMSFSQGIEPQFDKMDFEPNVAGGKIDMFIGYKGGEKHYFDGWGQPFAEGKAVSAVKALGTFFNGQGDNEGYLYQFTTDAGIYIQDGYHAHRVRGPHEDTYLCFDGRAFKQNGKWGFMYGNNPIVPALYDDIIEVWDMSHRYIGYQHIANAEYVILARKAGGPWVGFDKKGKRINVSTSAINRYLKVAPLDPQRFDPLANHRAGWICYRYGDSHLGGIILRQ